MFKFLMRKVGNDQLGNSYFLRRRILGRGFIRRVKYVCGVRDASCMPPEWDLWLRYTTDQIPESKEHNTGESSYYGNLSGSTFANLPAGHVLRKNRTIFTGYKRWVPSS